MKFTLLIMTMCFNTLLFAQNEQLDFKTDKSGKAYYEIVVEVKDAIKLRMYNDALTWVFATYGDSKKVIKHEDSESGKIQGKANTRQLKVKNGGFTHDGGYFKYDLVIQAKAEKVRLRIKNITYKKGEFSVSEGADFGEKYPYNWAKFGKKSMTKKWNYMRRQGQIEFKAILVNFKNTLLNGNNEDDDF